MANYPSGVWAPTTKVNDEIIQPNHINDAQAEVVAIESALVTAGLAHVLRFVDNTHDIGQNGAFRPRDLWLSRNADIQGTLAVLGIVSLATGSGNRVVIGGGATASELRFLEPSGSGSNFSAFKAQAQGADITYTLPATVGSAGQVLVAADGSGTLTWGSSASGDSDQTVLGVQVFS